MCRAEHNVEFHHWICNASKIWRKLGSRECHNTKLPLLKKKQLINKGENLLVADVIIRTTSWEKVIPWRVKSLGLTPVRRSFYYFWLVIGRTPIITLCKGCDLKNTYNVYKTKVYIIILKMYKQILYYLLAVHWGSFSVIFLLYLHIRPIVRLTFKKCTGLQISPYLFSGI